MTTCVDCHRDDCTVYVTQTAQIGKVRLSWTVCSRCLVAYEKRRAEEAR